MRPSAPNRAALDCITNTNEPDTSGRTANRKRTIGAATEPKTARGSVSALQAYGMVQGDGITYQNANLAMRYVAMPMSHIRRPACANHI
jgi:hypothetical protein